MSDLAMRIIISASDGATGIIKGVVSAISGGGGAGLLGAIADVGVAVVGLGVALGTESVHAAADFEQAMLSNVAHAGLAKDQFDKVSQSVLQMASDVGRAPTDLAEALYPILSAFSGIQNQSAKSSIALDTLRMSFETVAGTTVDGTAVAKAAVGTFNALGLATNDVSTNTQRMTGLFDVMDKTVQLGNMQWDDYKGAVTKVALAMQGTNLTFNETQAALAEMTNSGFPSAQKASTYLANTINTLEIKTNLLAAHAKKLHISFDEQKYSAMNLADKIAYLNQVTDGNKQKLLALMGNNSTALRTFNALSVGVQGYKSNLDALNHSQGALQNSFDVAKQGLNFHLQQAKAAIDSLFVTIGTYLLPVLSNLLGLVTPLISGFAKWISSSDGLQGILKQVGDAFNAVFNPVKQLTKAMQPIIELGKPLFDTFDHGTAILKDTYKGFGILTDTFDRASGIIKSTTQAVKPLTDTFDRAHGVIKSTAQAGLTLTDTFDRASGIIKTTTSSVKSSENPWKQFAQGIKNVVDFLRKIDWGGIGNAINNVNKSIAQVASVVKKVDWGSIFNAIGTGVQRVSSTLSKVDWGHVFKVLMDVVKQVNGFMRDTFLPVWQELVTDFNQVKAAIQPILPQLRQVAMVIGGIVVIAIILLIGIIAGLMKVLAAVITGVARFVTGFIQFFSGLLQTISGIIQLIVDVFTGKFGKIGTDLDNIMHGILEMFIGVWNMISGIWTIAIGSIEGFASGFVSAIIGIFTHLADMIVGHSIIPDMINGVVDWFLRLPGMAITGINMLVSAVTSTLNRFASQVVQLGDNIVHGIANGIMAGIHWVTGAIGNVTSWIASHLPHSPAKVGPLRYLDKSGAEIVRQLSGGMLSAKPTLQGSLNTVLAPGSRSVGMSRSGSGGGMTVIIEHIHVNDFGPNMPRTIANQIADQVDQKLGQRYRSQYSSASSGIF